MVIFHDVAIRWVRCSAGDASSLKRFGIPETHVAVTFEQVYRAVRNHGIDVFLVDGLVGKGRVTPTMPGYPGQGGMRFGKIQEALLETLESFDSMQVDFVYGPPREVQVRKRNRLAWNRNSQGFPA